MAQGKYLSLEEARKLNKLKQFAKEHPSHSDGRFGSLLDLMCKGDKVGTSDKGESNGNTETDRARRARQSGD